MADEQEIEITEDDIREAAARVEAAAEEFRRTAADEPAIVTETTHATTVTDEDGVTTTVEERVVETIPESAIETAPDMESVDEATLADVDIANVDIANVDVDNVDVANVEVDDVGLKRSAVAVYPVPDEDEFVVVEGSELMAARVAADEREEEIEGFTTLQALSLAFLVLLNIIVIGLGIWQVSRYFGWL